ncbi:MAG: hypothetical protein HRT44_02825 [Bdellovibrionales bacterium]|nr:hypothetical protein [Bdellovibrionales bacterium]NQZ18181.1 hypothetical protein [Bdellovibrionales bacterium]
MKQLTIALLVVFGTIFTAQANVPDEVCITIYAADSAFYATAAQSEKLHFVNEIYSMQLERFGSQATIYVQGSDGATTFLTKIYLEQACSVDVVEILEAKPL